MGSNYFMIYCLLVVKLFHPSQQAVYNRSNLKNLKNSIIVIKKNPYGDIIIKSETINMNATTAVSDDIQINNVSAVQNFTSDENSMNFNCFNSNKDINFNLNSSSNSYLASNENITSYNSSINYSSESEQEFRLPPEQMFTSICNVTSAEQSVTTRRRSLLRRLFDKIF
uniref:Uncharacterized protein n=1 Tax=Cacopsylla melanoneura TaxID=428564 RepID=A0A8D8QKZ1_9HEMI